jgi:hypothetical protein
MEDAATLHEWARISITIAHEAPVKKKTRQENFSTRRREA